MVFIASIFKIVGNNNASYNNFYPFNGQWISFEISDFESLSID